MLNFGLGCSSPLMHFVSFFSQDEDEYEKEDFTIKPTDNLVVLGKVHEDYGNLEIHGNGLLF